MRYARVWGWSLQKLFPVIQLRCACETWHMFLPISGLRVCILLQCENLHLIYLLPFFFFCIDAFFCHENSLAHCTGFKSYTYLSNQESTVHIFLIPTQTIRKSVCIMCCMGCHGKSVVFSIQLQRSNIWNACCSPTCNLLVCWASKDFRRSSLKGYPTMKSPKVVV